MFKRSVLVAASLAFAAPANAQNTRSLPPGAQSPGASIASLAWLTGEWEGEGLGRRAVETYSRPAAGQIAGHFLLEDGAGGVAFYELLQIVARGDTLLYRLRHFGPDLAGWEDASGKPVEFPLVAISPDAVHFDGLSLVRRGADAMEVTVRIAEGDAVREATFRYRRVRG